MKKAIGIILTTAMILSVISAGSFSGSAQSVGSSLPSKIDLRSYNGKNYVTPVKLQSPFGSCWAFSLAAAAETSYLFANDLGVPEGEENNNVDFSEKYINWYLYHGITNDDVTTGKVRASQAGEGFDVSEAEAKDSTAVYNMGGEFVQQGNFFASGFGPVDESVSVNGETPYYYSGKNRVRGSVGYSSNDDWSIPLNSQYRNAESSAIFRNMSVLPSPASEDENGSYKFDQTGVDAIKSEISQGRAVSFAFCVGANYMNSDNWAVYNFGINKADHAVTIVGYDDNYSKENFTRTRGDRVITKSTPPGDGAFIVKNSWGAVTEKDKTDTTTDKYGRTIYNNPNASSWGIDDTGYFYISYYDHSICSACSFSFDSSESANYSKQNIDQYDLLMTSYYDQKTYNTVTKMANIFDVEEDEYLYQISYRTVAPGTVVTYEIYSDVSDDPSSGILLEQGESTHEYGGSFRIDLEGEYLLKKGSKYSIVLTMRTVTGDGMPYNDVVPFMTNITAGQLAAKPRGVINKGESWLYTDGTWSDMSGIKDDLVERVYRRCADSDGENYDLLLQSGAEKEGFAVDNYPIKGISVPASEHPEITVPSATVIGDVNGDGQVNGADAGLLSRCASGWAGYADKIKNPDAADINRDGSVNGADAGILSRYVSGWNKYADYFNK